MPNLTSLEQPYAVTRNLTGRLIVELDASGNLFFKGANGNDLVRGTVVLKPNDSVRAIFKLVSEKYCGAAVFQPSGWTNGCDGEMSLTLGNVDFAYLNKGGYTPELQSQRFNEIVVDFKYVSDTKGSMEGFVGVDGVDFHKVTSLTPQSVLAPDPQPRVGRHSVAFVAYSEQAAEIDAATKLPRVTHMAAGGTVTFSFNTADAVADFSVDVF